MTCLFKIRMLVNNRTGILLANYVSRTRSFRKITPNFVEWIINLPAVFLECLLKDILIGSFRMVSHG